jgi:hypothetical protein
MYSFGFLPQPVIKYIASREAGGPRRPVDIPERILSDYDRRA